MGWISRNILWSKGINISFEYLWLSCFPKGLNWLTFPAYCFVNFSSFSHSTYILKPLSWGRLREKKVTLGEKLLLCQVLIEAQGTWGAGEGTCSSLVECHLKATLSVASLGLFTEILSKTSPSLVLEIP